ncbi:MAG: DUF4160 domain-containing protein [Desulfobacterales bacterium]
MIKSEKVGGQNMPIIARFYGILIKMYFKEHGLPHFHALYAEYNGVFNIDSLEMIEGDLPNRAQRLVKEWAEMYHDDLIEMWKTQSFKKLPGLE